MPEGLDTKITTHFATLEDPRTGPALLHPLLDIVAIALCAVICGADDWEEVELFGQTKEAWLRRFLSLPHGIPSHDTFNRVFARLNPEQFEACFASWVKAVAEAGTGKVLAIDGKALRRSHDHTLGKEAIHMVSAWAVDSGLVLGQIKVDDKSNEITAIPELLRWLDLKGCTVSIDAMGCQKEIAKQIIAQQGNYVLALKGNQEKLEERTQVLFAHAQTRAGREMEGDQARQVGKEHGRHEKRLCETLATREWLYYLDPDGAWPNLQTVARVTAERTLDGKTSVDTRYFISSLPCNAPLLLQSIRDHWGVENGLHWVLDVAFREDDSRVRKGHGAQNFSLLRRLALNLLRQDHSTKAGVKAKRRKAGWDEVYLAHILAP
jgi:predicted transposase YbfD/YdcC